MNTTNILESNINTVKSITQSIECTLGSHGLDVILLDDYGDYCVSNDGVKILSNIDTQHPIAKILIKASQHQEERVGDGTTTVIILINAILQNAKKYLAQNIKPQQLIRELFQAKQQAQEILASQVLKVNNIDDSKLYNTALIAGRQEKEILDLLLAACKNISPEKLLSRDFRLANIIHTQIQEHSELISGIIIKKRPISPNMPLNLTNGNLIIIHDDLVPEPLPAEAISTETGYGQFQQSQELFTEYINNIINSGVNLVLVHGNIHPLAEELFAKAGIIAVRRISTLDLEKIINTSEIKALKTNYLKHNKTIEPEYIRQFNNIRYSDSLTGLILDINNSQTNTVIIGATTESMAEEKKRVATDIAYTIQTVLQQGLVYGQGIAELNIIPELINNNPGSDCLTQALKIPLKQQCINAGLDNNIINSTINSNTSLQTSINLDTGESINIQENNIYDSYLVKKSAINIACDTAIQILKINNLVKSKQIV